MSKKQTPSFGEDPYKERDSKLKPYADLLEAMEAEGKKLTEMQAWLKEEGCLISLGGLSNFLSSRRQLRLQQQMLQQISTGARQCKEVEAQLAKSPAPETETLIKLARVLIMKFSTESNISPEMSELVFNMLKPVIKWHEVQIKEGALALERGKFEILTCEYFLKWFTDKRAQEIATSSASNAEKIAQLRQAYFADVDALQKSGTVKLPS
jgi:hypothetical protein